MDDDANIARYYDEIWKLQTDVARWSEDNSLRFYLGMPVRLGLVMVGFVLNIIHTDASFLYYINPLNWVTGLVDWAWNGITDWDEYLDPDEPDSLKYFRNMEMGITGAVRNVQDNSFIPNSSTELGADVLEIDYQGELISAAEVLPNHKKTPGTLGTLDKIAVSYTHLRAPET